MKFYKIFGVSVMVLLLLFGISINLNAFSGYYSMHRNNMPMSINDMNDMMDNENICYVNSDEYGCSYRIKSSRNNLNNQSTRYFGRCGACY